MWWILCVKKILRPHSLKWLGCCGLITIHSSATSVQFLCLTFVFIPHFSEREEKMRGVRSLKKEVRTNIKYCSYEYLRSRYIPNVQEFSYSYHFHLPINYKLYFVLRAWTHIGLKGLFILEIHVFFWIIILNLTSFMSSPQILASNVTSCNQNFLRYYPWIRFLN